MGKILASVELSAEELPLLQASILLAFREPRRLSILELSDKAFSSMEQTVMSYLVSGPKTKTQIKDHLESRGYARTGAGPTCSQLVKKGKVFQPERKIFKLGKK